MSQPEDDWTQLADLVRAFARKRFGDDVVSMTLNLRQLPAATLPIPLVRTSNGQPDAPPLTLRSRILSVLTAESHKQAWFARKLGTRYNSYFRQVWSELVAAGEVCRHPEGGWVKT